MFVVEYNDVEIYCGYDYTSAKEAYEVAKSLCCSVKEPDTGVVLYEHAQFSIFIREEYYI